MNLTYIEKYIFKKSILKKHTLDFHELRRIYILLINRHNWRGKDSSWKEAFERGPRWKNHYRFLIKPTLPFPGPLALSNGILSPLKNRFANPERVTLVLA